MDKKLKDYIKELREAYEQLCKTFPWANHPEWRMSLLKELVKMRNADRMSGVSARNVDFEDDCK